MELGEYNITEITAPEGYKATDEVFTVNVTSNGGILTIKNTKEKKEEPSKPEPKKPDVPDVEQPKNSETPKVEEPKKDTPEIKKPELSKPEHSTQVLTNTDKNSTQKKQTQTVKKDVPNTGDKNDIVFYSLLLMFTTAMIIRFKKKNN